MRIIRLLFILTVLSYAIQAQPDSPEYAMYQSASSLSLDIEGVIAAPTFSPDGRQLFFELSRNARNIGIADLSDIWVCYKKERQNWSVPVNLTTPVNNQFANSPSAFSSLESYLYIKQETSSGIPILSKVKKEGRKWIKSGEIHTNWSAEGFSVDRIRDYFVSADDQYLLFLAESNDDCGHFDIYVSLKTSIGEWASPTNLGPSINTDADEWDVYLAADNRTLYFSSNGQAGEGGYDIYVSTRLDDSWTNWTAPQNLGNTINTSKDEKEFSLPMDCREIVFTREGKLYISNLDQKYQPAPFAFLSCAPGPGVSQDQAFELAISAAGEDVTPQISSMGELQMVVPNDVVGLVYLSGRNIFGSSYPINLKAGRDIEHQINWSFLINNKTYQEREKEIEQIQRERLKIRKELKELNDQKNSLLQSPESWLPVKLNDFSLTSSDQQRINQIHAKYENIRKFIVPKDPVIKKQRIENLGVIDDNEEFYKQKLKDRFYKKFKIAQAETNKSEESIPVSTSVINNSIFPSFEEITQKTLKKQISDRGVSVWLNLQNQSIDQVITRFKTREPSLANTTIDEFQSMIANKNFPEQIFLSLWEDTSTVNFPWQIETIKALEEIIQPLVAKQFPDKIKTYVSDVLEINLKIALLMHKEEEKRESLVELINEQIVIESDIPVTEKKTLTSSENKRSNISQLIKTNLHVYPLQIGTSIPLNGITFKSNSTNLNPTAAVELDRVINLLETHPNLKIELMVATNGPISHSSALKLTKARAENISAYLINNDISEDRISILPFGKKPIFDHKDHFENSQVVLKIIE